MGTRGTAPLTVHQGLQAHSQGGDADGQQLAEHRVVVVPAGQGQPCRRLVRGCRAAGLGRAPRRPPLPAGEDDALEAQRGEARHGLHHPQPAELVPHVVVQRGPGLRRARGSLEGAGEPHGLEAALRVLGQELPCGTGGAGSRSWPSGVGWHGVGRAPPAARGCSAKSRSPCTGGLLRAGRRAGANLAQVSGRHHPWRWRDGRDRHETLCHHPGGQLGSVWWLQQWCHQPRDRVPPLSTAQGPGMAPYRSARPQSRARRTTPQVRRALLSQTLQGRDRAGTGT